MSNERKYTNYEINQCFDHMQEQLNRIEEQVMKTNSRVKKLELWKAWFMGALSLLTVLVIPLAIAFIKPFIDSLL